MIETAWLRKEIQGLLQVRGKGLKSAMNVIGALKKHKQIPAI